MYVLHTRKGELNSMNIFVLDLDPQKAAQWHMDAHVSKMVVETAQLLCTVHHLTGGTAPYKATHSNHPCSVWARESLANYLWLKELGLELCIEYTARYGRTHATEAVMQYCSNNIPPILTHRPLVGLTPFAQAMPPHLRESDPVAAYRSYYATKRGGRLGTWKRNKPEWLPQYLV